MPLMTVRQYAVHRGVADNAVRQAIDDGRLSRSYSVTSAGNGKKMYSIDSEAADLEWPRTDEEIRRSEAMKKIVKPGPRPSAPDEPGVPSYAESRAKKEAALAALAEIQLLEKQGKVADTVEIAKQWNAIGSTVRTKVLGIPSKFMQRVSGITPEQYAELEAIVRDTLVDLSNEGSDPAE